MILSNLAPAALADCLFLAIACSFRVQSSGLIPLVNQFLLGGVSSIRVLCCKQGNLDSLFGVRFS